MATSNAPALLDQAGFVRSGLNATAATLQGSSILAIAGQVRQLMAQGKEVCNLTIGDFEPKEYPLPPLLLEGTAKALAAGQSNYPPANGVLELRQAIQAMYQRRVGLDVGLERILVAGGARPVIYACYRAVINPGDKVVYGVPSWNNNHYAHIAGAVPVEIAVGPEDNFFPRLDQIEPHLHDAALIVVNSPQNPSGTCISEEALQALCDRIVAENDRRKPLGQRPVFLLYDQIYWMITFGQVRHYDPILLNPAMADYTIYVDGISKAFAATGLRVGWTIGPVAVIDAMNKVLGHVGAWAPKAEQVATAQLLADDAAVSSYLAFIQEAAGQRLQVLYDGLTALGQKYPIRALVPQGAIYLSAEFALRGWRTPTGVLETASDVRIWLLEQSGMALVPFDAFGAKHATDWYRASVGAVGVADLEKTLARLQIALQALQPPA